MGDKGSKSDYQIYHLMNCIGYSDDYFLLHNTWGKNWGEEGTMRISRVPDECGVNGMYQHCHIPYMENHLTEFNDLLVSIFYFVILFIKSLYFITLIYVLIIFLIICIYIWLGMEFSQFHQDRFPEEYLRYLQRQQQKF